MLLEAMSSTFSMTYILGDQNGTRYSRSVQTGTEYTRRQMFGAICSDILHTEVDILMTLATVPFTCSERMGGFWTRTRRFFVIINWGCESWIPSWFRNSKVWNEFSLNRRCWLFERYSTISFIVAYNAVFSRSDWVISTLKVLPPISASLVKMLHICVKFYLHAIEFKTSFASFALSRTRQ